jgi:undecaprenyl diphosphate synthase
MNSIKNVAIIMDGNGRWAKQRHRPRVWGHVRGSNKVNEIVSESAALGLESLTLYAFSTENWSRPTDEVTNLFKLLKKFLSREKKNLIKNNIKFNVIGNYKVLDTSIVKIIDDIEDATASNTGMVLSLAINYGGRAEIIDAVNKCLQESDVKEITEEDITNNLYNPLVKNIDLLIRTAGDKRVSNFLLWQICYSEFYFTETKWPEFSIEEYKKILDEVGGRDRRFGGIDNNSNLKENQNQANRNLKILS